MAYAYPSTINGTKGFGEVLSYINNVTNQWISNMIIIAIYVIILMGYYKAKEDFAGALAVAGFGTFVVGLLFWLGGFVSGTTFAIIVAVAIVGVIVILVDNNQQ